MHWEGWVIPIIAMAVWIVASVFRAGEQERQRRASRPLPRGQGTERPRPRNPREDREAALREPLQPGGVAPRPRETKQPAPAPVRQARRAQGPAPQPRPVPPPAPVQPKEVILEVLPVAEPAPAAAVVSVPAARSRPLAPALNGLVQLLGSRDGLRSAILLNEVFAPPLCRRPRQR